MVPRLLIQVFEVFGALWFSGTAARSHPSDSFRRGFDGRSNLSKGLTQGPNEPQLTRGPQKLAS